MKGGLADILLPSCQPTRSGEVLWEGDHSWSRKEGKMPIFKRRGELREITQSHIISLDVEIEKKEDELIALRRERKTLQDALNVTEPKE